MRNRLSSLQTKLQLVYKLRKTILRAGKNTFAGLLQPLGRMFGTPELEICDGYVIVDLKVESLRKVSGQQFFLVVFLTVAAGGKKVKLLCVDSLGVTASLNFLP